MTSQFNLMAEVYSRDEAVAIDIEKIGARSRLESESLEPFQNTQIRPIKQVDVSFIYI